MTERLFFALWPGDEQRRGLTALLRRLPRHHGRETHPEDLHITVVFLGDLEREGRTCAEEVADRARAAPFVLQLDRIGCFPRPRILWCGASDRPRPLLKLVGDLSRGLRDCGFEPERRPYTPHVTLVRKARPIQTQTMDTPLSWPVRDFVLVAGQGGAPPRYRVLRRWPLAS